MTRRPTLCAPHQILSSVASPVPVNLLHGDIQGAKYQALFNDLAETMDFANGLGLAAPQLVEPHRVVALNIVLEKVPPGNLWGLGEIGEPYWQATKRYRSDRPPALIQSRQLRRKYHRKLAKVDRTTKKLQAKKDARQAASDAARERALAVDNAQC